jgi:hypothetical protein
MSFRMLSFVKRYWPDAVYLLLAAGIARWIAWDAFHFRLITHSPGSDYWEHTAVLHALLENPWHPAHPLIASEVTSPRFGPHFLWLALVGRALHFDAIDTMALTAVVNCVLFLAGIWWFCRTYYREPLASLYGLVIFFGTWLEAPHFSNVYKLKVFFSVAGYPSSAALAITLFGLGLVVRLLRAERRSWPGLALSALIWAYVYVTHPLTATMALPAAVLLALTEPDVPRPRRLWVAGSVVAGFFLSAAWPYYPALGMVLGGTVHRVRGLEPEAFAPQHEFYEHGHLFNILGYCLISFLVLPYLWVRRQDVFVVLGACLMLFVFALGALLPIPLGHRYVLLSVFFLQLALVRLLLNLTPRVASGWSRHWPLRAGAVLAVGAFLVWLCVSNVEAALEHFRRTAAASHDKEGVPLRNARRVGELAGPHAIVLSTALGSWALPTFGPKIVTPLHKNPLIPDAEERRHAALDFFSPRASEREREAIVAHYHVTHVLVPQRNLPAVRDFLQDDQLIARLAGGFSLYQIAPTQPPGKDR